MVRDEILGLTRPVRQLVHHQIAAGQLAEQLPPQRMPRKLQELRRGSSSSACDETTPSTLHQSHSIDQAKLIGIGRVHLHARENRLTLSARSRNIIIPMARKHIAENMTQDQRLRFGTHACRSPTAAPGYEHRLDAHVRRSVLASPRILSSRAHRHAASSTWARASGGAAVSNTDGRGFDTFRACSSRAGHPVRPPAP